VIYISRLQNKYKPTKFLKDDVGVNHHIALGPLMFIANMHYFQCHFLSILVKLDYISYCFPLIFFLHCSINVLVVLPFFLIVFPLILCFWCSINMFTYNCIFSYFFSFLFFFVFLVFHLCFYLTFVKESPSFKGIKYFINKL